MTKRKNIEWKAGMVYENGPPRRAGGYDKWNWCRICTTLVEKKCYRCPDCNQMVRTKSRASGNQKDRSVRDAERIEVIKDLSRRTR